jgi:hypothetical protein
VSLARYYQATTVATSQMLVATVTYGLMLQCLIVVVPRTTTTASCPHDGGKEGLLTLSRWWCSSLSSGEPPIRFACHQLDSQATSHILHARVKKKGEEGYLHLWEEEWRGGDTGVEGIGC